MREPRRVCSALARAPLSAWSTPSNFRLEIWTSPSSRHAPRHTDTSTAQQRKTARRNTYGLARLDVARRRGRGHGARTGRHRQHDPEADGDNGANRDPDAGNLFENARLPQGQHRPEEQHEIADEVQLQELHAFAKSKKSAGLGTRRSFVVFVRAGFSRTPLTSHRKVAPTHYWVMTTTR